MLKGISGIAVLIGLCGCIGVFGLTGCGGGDGSTLSKAEYIQQLELVCNKGLQKREEFIENGNKEAEKNPKRESQAETEAVQAGHIRELMAIYSGTTKEIADLSPPEQVEKKAEELVQAREDAAAKVDADPVKAVGEGAALFAKTAKAAEDLEVSGCGK